MQCDESTGHGGLLDVRLESGERSELATRLLHPKTDREPSHNSKALLSPQDYTTETSQYTENLKELCGEHLHTHT